MRYNNKFIDNMYKSKEEQTNGKKDVLKNKKN